MLYRYVPAIGRFLIVVTFIEDALRIVTQWSDQLVYLHDYRHCACPLQPRSLFEPLRLTERQSRPASTIYFC